MTEKQRKEIGDICRQTRIDNNMTVREMSKYISEESGGTCSYSYSEISRIELGERRLPFELAVYYMKLGADLSAVL